MLSQTSEIIDIMVEDEAEEKVSECLKKNTKQIKLKSILVGEGALLFCSNLCSTTNY